jgi:two-component system, OmpR family, alkaline phosphatase synthesis response regulator PhoP
LQRVVLAGGDGHERRALRDELARSGFVVSECEGDERLGEALNQKPDALVADLTGRGRGHLGDLLRELGREGTLVTIAVVPYEEMGAFDPALPVEDIILSPPDPRELVLRLRRCLWRRARVDAENVLRAGELLIDLANYKVFVAGRQAELTYKEYELLRFLAANREKVFTREALLNRVWGYDYYGGARTVDVHIRRLRSKIEDTEHQFIETIRNVGYRFKAD